MAFEAFEHSKFRPVRMPFECFFFFNRRKELQEEGVGSVDMQGLGHAAVIMRASFQIKKSGVFFGVFFFGKHIAKNLKEDKFENIRFVFVNFCVRILNSK